MKKKAQHGVVIDHETVFLPKNGCVLHKGEIMLRLVYANEETVEVVLGAIKEHLEERRRR